MPGFVPSDTCFDIAVRIAREVMKSHILTSASDKMAVIFYGTRETRNRNSHEHVYTFQELDEPDAQRIRDMETIAGPNSPFKEEIGSCEDGGHEHLRYGLWAAGTALSGPERAQKRILLFFSDLQPGRTGKDAKTLRDKILTRVEHVHEAGISLELMPMIPRGDQLDPFWAEVVQASQDENDEPNEILDVQYHLATLSNTVRQKAYKKRAVVTLAWRFPGGLHMAVGVYQLFAVARKGAGTYLEAQNNMPLNTETAYIDMDTGAPLPTIKKRVFPPPTKAYEHTRFPRIVLEVDELRDLKAVQEPGLTLLGFKPMASLKDWHQLRSPSFLYPAEKARAGSSRLFIALHDALLVGNYFALCALVRTRSSEPRLVAVVPQREVVDLNGTQVEPPGLNMIYLPYSDDIRYPEADPNFTGDSSTVADEGQIQAACHLLDALSFSEEEPFLYYEMPNPALQRHYQALEALALGEEPPMKIEDLTLAHTGPAGQKKAQTAAASFLALFEQLPTGKKSKAEGAGSKRKAPDKDKEQAIDNALADVDFKALAAAGTLGGLTNDMLKAYLQQQGLPRSGKKADLVQRVINHLAGTSG